MLRNEKRIPKGVDFDFKKIYNFVNNSKGAVG